jgi:hypothetical protein
VLTLRQSGFYQKVVSFPDMYMTLNNWKTKYLSGRLWRRNSRCSLMLCHRYKTGVV